MTVTSPYETYRPLLTNLAYQMLGSMSDAEDIVQDIFLDYYQIDRSAIMNEKAFLVRMATNRCLNLLSSARKRRETYVGNWLPEPAVTYGGNMSADPMAYWERNEAITYAMLVVLERLSGIERAVFLLRETFAFDYHEIAQIVGKSEANCRKIRSRAKDKLGDTTQIPPFRNERADQLARAFIAAAETGDTESLISLLAEDAVMISDGGGKVRAAIFPIVGRDRVIAFYEGMSRKKHATLDYVPALVNGQSGLVLLQEGQAVRVMTFQWDSLGERIEHIYLVMNPDKLAYVTNEGAILS